MIYKHKSNKKSYKPQALQRLFLLVFFIVIFLLTISTSQAQTAKVNDINVVFINPDNKGNPYWAFISNTMKKAAKDFGIKLHIINTDRHHLHNSEPLFTKLRSMEKPDYLIYIYQQKLGIKLLEFAEKNQIKSFILNTSISKKDSIKVGKPTEKFKFWIGHSYPKLADVALQLSQEAYKLAKHKQLKEKNIYSVVLSGSRDTDVASQWDHGAMLSSQGLDDYQVRQIVYSDFNSRKGYQQMKRLLVRYPETSVVMSVDENVTLSAIRAAEELGRRPGEDIFFASSVALHPSLEMVKNNKLIASYALSIWSGVYSIVYLYDYHQGIISSTQELTYNYADTIISHDEIETYDKIMSDNLWQTIDYKSFSRSFSAETTKYDFSAQAFDRALQTLRSNLTQ